MLGQCSITELQTPKPLFLKLNFKFFETGSSQVTQAGLDLAMCPKQDCNLPDSASHVPGFTGT